MNPQVFTTGISASAAWRQLVAGTGEMPIMTSVSVGLTRPLNRLLTCCQAGAPDGSPGDSDASASPGRLWVTVGTISGSLLAGDQLPSGDHAHSMPKLARSHTAEIQCQEKASQANGARIRRAVRRGRGCVDLPNDLIVPSGENVTQEPPRSRRVRLHVEALTAGVWVTETGPSRSSAGPSWPEVAAH
jgi:hypothetical protein